MDPSLKYIVVTVPADQITRFETGSEVDVVFAGQRRTGRIEQIPMEVNGNGQSQSGMSVTIVPSGRLWPAVPIGAAVEVRVRR